MKAKYWIMILIASFFLLSCGGQPTAVSTLLPTNTPTNTPQPTETAVPTNTAKPTDIPPTEPPLISFRDKVRPILLSRCVVCHGGSRGTEEGLSLLTYETLVAGSDNGPVIVPNDADSSLLVELVTKQEMPKRGPKLTPPQVQLIVDWVNQGALDN